MEGIAGRRGASKASSTTGMCNSGGLKPDPERAPYKCKRLTVEGYGR